MFTWIGTALNALADDIYHKNVEYGWHTTDGPDMARFTANLHGEVSELWEAYRRGELNKPCDKAEKMTAHGLPVLTCVEEEIADIVIRALDTGRAYGVDIDRAVAVKRAFNATRPPRHGGKLA